MGNSSVGGSAEESMWSVLLLNDDQTPMEFVVHVIEEFFDADHDSAVQIMYRVHNEGRAECGIYPCEEAKTKAKEVNDVAREHGHPLRCVTEQKH
jgi:ATP-dependent Clp protease adaptor protein ClpS